MRSILILESQFFVSYPLISSSLPLKFLSLLNVVVIIAIIVKQSNSHPETKNMTQFNRLPYEIVVIGDRIEVDLSPAKELGMHTIHFNNGRGKVENFIFHRDVDYQICSLRDVSDMINKIEIKNYSRKT